MSHIVHPLCAPGQGRDIKGGGQLMAGKGRPVRQIVNAHWQVAMETLRGQCNKCGSLLVRLATPRREWAAPARRRRRGVHWAARLDIEFKLYWQCYCYPLLSMSTILNSSGYILVFRLVGPAIPFCPTRERLARLWLREGALRAPLVEQPSVVNMICSTEDTWRCGKKDKKIVLLKSLLGYRRFVRNILNAVQGVLRWRLLAFDVTHAQTTNAGFMFSDNASRPAYVSWRLWHSSLYGVNQL